MLSFIDRDKNCIKGGVKSHMNFLLKSEPQRIRTSTGMFLFDSSYAVFRDFLLIIYLDTISEKAEISKPKRLNRMNPNP